MALILLSYWPSDVALESVPVSLSDSSSHSFGQLSIVQ